MSRQLHASSLLLKFCVQYPFQILINFCIRLDFPGILLLKHSITRLASLLSKRCIVPELKGNFSLRNESFSKNFAFGLL